jgi:hypothetical protein
MHIVIIVLETDPEEQDEVDEKEEEAEVEQEEESYNSELGDQINLEALNSENDNTSTLDLSMKGLTDADMKILGDILRNNKVRE